MQTILEKDFSTLSEEIASIAKSFAAEIDEKDVIPEILLDLLWEKGLLNLIPISETKLQTDTLCTIVENISTVSAGLALLVIVQAVGVLPLYLGATAEQKRFFANEIEKRKYIAFALTESKSGSDAQSIRTSAEKHEGYYLINGNKIFVTNGKLADYFVVFAQTPPLNGRPSISAFIIEKNSPGLEVGPQSDLIGMRGVPTTFLALKNVKVPLENRLGKEGEGFKLAMKTLDFSRPYIAAQAVGIASGALEIALQYAKKRVLFGQPISEQQSIQFTLADMATQIEAAKGLVKLAACSLDNQDKSMSMHSAMSKYYASDVAMKVTTDAFQILGGYGCIRGGAIERMMRDAKITQIFEGTNQIQRIVVGKSLLRESNG